MFIFYFDFEFLVRMVHVESDVLKLGTHYAIQKYIKKYIDKTVQTQIRLLLKKQFNQGLPFSDKHKHFVNSSPNNQQLI